MKEKDNEYIITGGEEGKKRLNVLADVLSSYTKALLEKDGPIHRKKILDLGCGGGNVALMASKMVGEEGYVTAIDFDSEIISLAKQDAINDGVNNISFEAQSAYDITFDDRFDIAYSRFLLSHLRQPELALQNMLKSAKPGARIIVEDVEFSGHFCYPSCKAFDSYIKYYTAAATHNEQNPEIGPSLFQLFHSAGIKNIQFDIIQPCFSQGAGKRMAYITMDKIKSIVIKQGLADIETIDTLLRELDVFTQNEQTIISLPRIFRVWGYKQML
jgi:ubiquinone/menaquinone biosynthesis C-methylase UbiE